ncbi:nascent polypeptide-associated complex subunit alpha, muscle-specific form-like [Pollicipes pollicipes]|uniref:nascent polypeptide-associated complex subunit alpha, muscle-specific form-like n=1 Tax=Pollicipes pollicipes TaxID=41117 RepID=UPI001884CAC2|nr:nascent polypeptide-associated complex subunit alpha, muscle-specific form-like [Pollicipes pollicipes]
MVMKVDGSKSQVRYFIHFPNLDTRHDRWVAMRDIIQVYRTEDDTTHAAAGAPAAAASPSRPTKRRLAFDPSPGRRLPFEPSATAERPVPHDEAGEAPVTTQLASRRQCGHPGKQAARKSGSPKQARSRTLAVPHSPRVEGVTGLTPHAEAPDRPPVPPAKTGLVTQASGSAPAPRTRRSCSVIVSVAQRPGPPSHPPAQPQQETGVAMETPDRNQSPPAQAAPVTQATEPPGRRRGRPPKAITNVAQGTGPPSHPPAQPEQETGVAMETPDRNQNPPAQAAPVTQATEPPGRRRGRPPKVITNVVQSTGPACFPPAHLEREAGVARERPHEQIGREPRQVGSVRRRIGAKTTKECVTSDVPNLPALTGRDWEDTGQAPETLIRRSGPGAPTGVCGQRGGRRATRRCGPTVKADPADDPAPDRHQSILLTNSGGAVTEPALRQDMGTACLRARDRGSRGMGDGAVVDVSTSHVNVSDGHAKISRGMGRSGRPSVASAGKDPSPAGEAPGDSIRTQASADADARPAAGADPPPAPAATGPRKRRAPALKTRPPKGVIIQPAAASVLETLRAGSVVYVACWTDSHGWRCLYPAEVVRVNRDLWYPQYRVHYPGWRAKHDEWIAEDVIHSVVTSHSQMTVALRHW